MKIMWQHVNGFRQQDGKELWSIVDMDGFRRNFYLQCIINEPMNMEDLLKTEQDLR